ncbi:hypothetical protein [Streptomyces sp. CB02261]|uniref:hypothetical protein n=1 Tax=Streptomyces sp. CB02261 TaxID=1703940 RepID=UPI00130132A0|nr:hypothetical protein [Streptomyces sp. CB02261]
MGSGACGDRIGAYVYFTHRTWSTDWGGGLALIDEESRADAADGTALSTAPPTRR